MKYFVLINSLFIFFTGCTSKLPIPGSDNIESILIIPHKATNKTKNPFGFKYIFTLKTEDGMEKIIEFYPRTNKQYFMLFLTMYCVKKLVFILFKNSIIILKFLNICM